MKVFISWSGEESHAVAQVLRAQLPCIINAAKPFVSSEDISKGAAWFQHIGVELEKSDFGIVCLTTANQNSKWVQFEAGALAGRFSRARVAPLLIKATPTSIKPPLSQFQLTSLENKDDFFKLLASINSCLGEAALSQETLKQSFDNWWTPFLQKIRTALNAVPKKEVEEVERSDKEILEEILGIVRSLRTPAYPGLLEELAKRPKKRDLLSMLGGYADESGIDPLDIIAGHVPRKPFVSLGGEPALEKGLRLDTQ